MTCSLDAFPPFLLVPGQQRLALFIIPVVGRGFLGHNKKAGPWKDRFSAAADRIFIESGRWIPPREGNLPSEGVPARARDECGRFYRKPNWKGASPWVGFLWRVSFFVRFLRVRLNRAGGRGTTGHTSVFWFKVVNLHADVALVWHHSCEARDIKGALSYFGLEERKLDCPPMRYVGKWIPTASSLSPETSDFLSKSTSSFWLIGRIHRTKRRTTSVYFLLSQ